MTGQLRGPDCSCPGLSYGYALEMCDAEGPRACPPVGIRFGMAPGRLPAIRGWGRGALMEPTVA